MKNYKTILKEKHQKYQHYPHTNLANMNILQVTRITFWLKSNNTTNKNF